MATYPFGVHEHEQQRRAMDMAKRLLRAKKRWEASASGRKVKTDSNLSRILANDPDYRDEEPARVTTNPQLWTLVEYAERFGITLGELLGEAGFELDAHDRDTLRGFRRWIDGKLEPIRDARSEPNAKPLNITLAEEEAPAPEVVNLDGRVSRRRAKPPVESPKLSERWRAAAGPNTIIRSDDPDLPLREIPSHYYYEKGAREVVKVEGDSMIDLGITPHDLLFIRPESDPRQLDGEIVVCSVDGSEFVKILDLSEGKIRLISANDQYPPMEVDEEEFRLVGVVVGRSGYPWREGRGGTRNRNT